jgi:hypothetical protein
MIIKQGSKWWTGSDKKFVVLHVIEQDGHTWVHYRDENNQSLETGPQEYSCYAESFLNRFSLILE